MKYDKIIEKQDVALREEKIIDRWSQYIMSVRSHEAVCVDILIVLEPFHRWEDFSTQWALPIRERPMTSKFFDWPCHGFILQDMHHPQLEGMQPATLRSEEDCEEG